MPKQVNRKHKPKEKTIQLYEIEAIIDYRYVQGVSQFKLQWKGFPPSAASWEKESKINAPMLLQQFKQNHPTKFAHEDSSQRESSSEEHDNEQPHYVDEEEIERLRMEALERAKKMRKRRLQIEKERNELVKPAFRREASVNQSVLSLSDGSEEEEQAKDMVIEPSPLEPRSTTLLTVVSEVLTQEPSQTEYLPSPILDHVLHSQPQIDRFQPSTKEQTGRKPKKQEQGVPTEQLEQDSPTLPKEDSPMEPPSQGLWEGVKRFGTSFGSLISSPLKAISKQIDEPTEPELY